MRQAFLSERYFVGELYIPNLKTQDDMGIGVNEIVQAVGEKYFDTYVQQYEYEYLSGLMGDEMLSSFYDKVEDDEVWNTLKDRIFNYRRLPFVSPAANYVYFKAMRDMQTQTSPQGEVRGTQDNTIVVSAYEKLVRVWNNMVGMTEDIRKFIRDNVESYGVMKGYRVWERINKFGI